MTSRGKFWGGQAKLWGGSGPPWQPSSSARGGFPPFRVGVQNDYNYGRLTMKRLRPTLLDWPVYSVYQIPYFETDSK